MDIIIAAPITSALVLLAIAATVARVREQKRLQTIATGLEHSYHRITLALDELDALILADEGEIVEETSRPRRRVFLDAHIVIELARSRGALRKHEILELIGSDIHFSPNSGWMGWEERSLAERDIKMVADTDHFHPDSTETAWEQEERIRKSDHGTVAPVPWRNTLGFR